MYRVTRFGLTFYGGRRWETRLLVELFAISVGVAFVLSGCSFYWDGPVEVRLTNGSVMQCDRIMSTTDRRNLICEQNKRSKALSWSIVAGLRTL